jgi:oxygen-independent coproporphyrinogen-3 oxidase
MLALGVSGISQIQHAFLQNHTRLDDYQTALKHDRLAVCRGYFLTDDDRMRRDIINTLACQGMVDLSTISVNYQRDARHDFVSEWAQLAELEQDGLVQLNNTTIRVTAMGRLLLRPILMVFDAYLNASNKKRFSRVM